MNASPKEWTWHVKGTQADTLIIREPNRGIKQVLIKLSNFQAHMKLDNCLGVTSGTQRTRRWFSTSGLDMTLYAEVNLYHLSALLMVFWNSKLIGQKFTGNRV